MTDSSAEPELFPANIIIFCDECGKIADHDYLVSENDDQERRFRYARQYLKDEEGWLILQGELDICAECAANFR